jgi:hypothetical protein
MLCHGGPSPTAPGRSIPPFSLSLRVFAAVGACRQGRRAGSLPTELLRLRLCAAGSGRANRGGRRRGSSRARRGRAGGEHGAADGEARRGRDLGAGVGGVLVDGEEALPHAAHLGLQLVQHALVERAGRLAARGGGLGVEGGLDEVEGGASVADAEGEEALVEDVGVFRVVTEEALVGVLRFGIEALDVEGDGAVQLLRALLLESLLLAALGDNCWENTAPSLILLPNACMLL